MLPPVATVCVPGEADREKALGITVMVTVGGLGSVTPALSVTVNEDTYVPAAEKVTLPAFASVLELGVPPGKTHE